MMQSKIGRRYSGSRLNMVVMLTCQYTEILGGAEKQCAALTQNLISAGVNVVVLTSRVPGLKIPETEEGVIRFWTYCPPQLAGRHLPASLLWAIQALIWIAWNHRRISILHCHQLRINSYVAALANVIFRIPTVMKLGVGGARNDFNVIGQRKYLLGRSGARFVIRQSNAVIAISSEIEKNCLECGVPAARVNRIPNGVDLDRTKENNVECQSNRFKNFKHCIRFAFIGRLSPEKNVLTIVEAVKNIQTEKKFCLELLGDGPLKETIKSSLPSNSGVEIVLKGRVEEVFTHLSRIHFIVLASSSEGLSNALLESACVGVVPILSDVSGSRDVIDFCDYPLFVKGTGTDQIQHALERGLYMSAAEWESWSSKISDHSRARYDAEIVRDRYLALYNKLSGVIASR